MTDTSKVKPSHTQRSAFVYIRQSTPSQVERHRESTARQYALVQRAWAGAGVRRAKCNLRFTFFVVSR